MSRPEYPQFLLPEAQELSFMKQTELFRWIVIMWWISRIKSEKSVDKMRTGRSLRHSLRCRSLTERIRQPDTSGNRCTAEETAADEEDVRDPAVLRDRVL